VITTPENLKDIDNQQRSELLYLFINTYKEGTLCGKH